MFIFPSHPLIRDPLPNLLICVTVPVGFPQMISQHIRRRKLLEPALGLLQRHSFDVCHRRYQLLPALLWVIPDNERDQRPGRADKAHVPVTFVGFALIDRLAAVVDVFTAEIERIAVQMDYMLCVYLVEPPPEKYNAAILSDGSHLAGGVADN